MQKTKIVIEKQFEAVKKQPISKSVELFAYRVHICSIIYSCANELAWQKNGLWLYQYT